MKLFSKNRKEPKLRFISLYFLSSLIFLYIPLGLCVIKIFYWGLSWYKSILFILIIFSFNVYRTIIAGWSSNSKYSLIGRIRRVAQTISYEIPLSTILLLMALIRSTLYISYFVQINSYVYSFLPLNVLFVVLILTLIIELNRTPFDLSECESELVSGFNVEYGSIEFSLIFLGENLIIIVRAFIISLFFINYIFSFLIIFYFVWVRARFPRQRFDMIINLCWFIILPLSLSLPWFILNLIFYKIKSFSWLSYSDR